LYRFNVVSDNPLNSGTVTDSRLSPKLNFVLGPWRTVEYFLNLGEGFHSNDARGTTIRVDPKSGERVDRVSPLVRSRGGEVGVKADIVPGVQSALSVFRLDFASELVFAGDAGTTVASRPSRRIGVEFANQVKYGSWLAVDTSIAFSKARFRDSNPVGSRVPGAVEGVASVAISIDNTGPCFGVLQWRYFGPRPLIENNSVRSSSTAQFNGRLGYKLGNGFRLELEGYNLTNHKASAIDYYYYSRLKGESTEGVRDVHFHPLEPRSFRFTAKLAF
jgi:outer membrane receptor protein involved in Fe transport